MQDSRLVLNVIRIFRTRKHRMFIVISIVKPVMVRVRNMSSAARQQIYLSLQDREFCGKCHALNAGKAKKYNISG